jgi:hypothetical protein
MGEVQAVEIMAWDLNEEQKDFLVKKISEFGNEKPDTMQNKNGTFNLEYCETDYMCWGTRDMLVELKKECRKRGIKKIEIRWGIQQEIEMEEI